MEDVFPPKFAGTPSHPTFGSLNPGTVAGLARRAVGYFNLIEGVTIVNFRIDFQLLRGRHYREFWDAEAPKNGPKSSKSH